MIWKLVQSALLKRYEAPSIEKLYLAKRLRKFAEQLEESGTSEDRDQLTSLIAQQLVPPSFIDPDSQQVARCDRCGRELKIDIRGEDPHDYKLFVKPCQYCQDKDIDLGRRQAYNQILRHIISFLGIPGYMLADEDRDA